MHDDSVLDGMITTALLSEGGDEMVRILQASGQGTTHSDWAQRKINGDHRQPHVCCASVSQ